MREDIATDTELTSVERSDLAAVVPQNGFKVLQKIFAIEVEKFREALLNADPVNREDVLAAHNLAKAAAMFYAGVTNRINEEITFLRNAPRVGDKPEESVAEVLDFGEHAERDYQFLGGENNGE